MMYAPNCLCSRSLLIVIVSCVFLSIMCFASLAAGQYAIPISHVWGALWSNDTHSIEHVIVTTTRLSRTVVACAVGAGLAVAGVLMQSLTRNPLASPAIFGVNGGAVFLIVLVTQFLGVGSLNDYIWIAFAGAAFAGSLVYGIGMLGQDGLSPVRVVLAGAAISALFMSFTQGMLVLGQEGIDSVLFWVAGSVSGRELSAVLPVLPYIGVSIAIALLLSPHLNILLSGDAIATGLGQNTALLKVVISLLVIVLAGASVSIAGSIGFIGLIVPHMVRRVSGHQHQWLLALSALWGASLLLVADIASRLLLAPQEIPIGAMTAIFGAPLFVYLARKGKTHD
ncbi:MAG: FecCD family ABC transporter permease [Vibrio sp.]